LCRIMKSQSVIFEFFALSNIPVKIVNELFSQRNPVSPLAKKNIPKGDTPNTSNTSSDFSITTSNAKDVSGRYSPQFRNDRAGGPAAVLLQSVNAPPGGQESGAPPGACFAFFAVLIFMFMRARSALPDAAAIFSFAKNRTQFNNLNWVFSLSIINPQRSFL